MEHDPSKRFYSIEYVDEDGDQVIKHGFMTPTEAEELHRQFLVRGIRSSINDLSSTPFTRPVPAVISRDDQVPRLEGHDPGVHQ
jgi:hypothetical protein